MIQVHIREFGDVASACRRFGSCTVAEGSVLLQDTVPKMLDALRDLCPEYADRLQGGAMPLVAVRALADLDDIWWTLEEADYAFTRLSEALNEVAPEDFTFETHPSDGACLGFWKVDVEG